MDYSQTLNLPRTGFPMKANLPEREPATIEFWERERIYNRLLERDGEKPKYVLHDGPPYSNGPIHLGQALNKILKDILIKYKSLRGYNAPFVPGWDTHGLPNEIQAIKEFKINRHEIDPVELRKKCAESALKFMAIQKEQFKRLGIRGDWDHPYLTLHPYYEAAIIRVFGEMADRGLIYKGLKPVYWCSHCETALAEAEIEYQDKVSNSIYVAFPFSDDPASVFPGFTGKASFIIWTTTPWTLPGNVAIAIHPSMVYLMVQVGGEGYIVAEPLLAEAAGKLGWHDYKIAGRVTGARLEGLKTRHPFLDRDSVIILEEYVTMDQGTGCVHTAPGHGQEDYEASLTYNLPILVPVDAHGRMTAEAGQFAGLHYSEANKAIIEHMKSSGHLLYTEKITHSYPHCWRCKNPVIFRATEQWFVKIDKDDLRGRLLKEIEQVRWIPTWGEGRMHNMVADRPDWCISRQRVWGTSIPAFYCKKCEHVLFGKEISESVAALFEKEGGDSWFIREASELLPEGCKCPSCGSSDFRKEMNIFDVWFESGVSHEAVLGLRQELSWPCDLYLEGCDQHRGWFQASLIPAVAVRGKAPYRAVLTHGWMLDEQGRAQHKSLGNAIDPQEVVKKYGADILRLQFASVDYTADIKIGDDNIRQVAEVYKKIRNTLRFILSNLYDYDPEKDFVPDGELLFIDRWALHQLGLLSGRIRQAFDDYQFHLVYYHLHNFCVRDMSAFYLDVLKDRLYTMPAKSPERRSAQRALFEIASTLAILMTPILSFTAEEIWQHLPHPEMRTNSVQMASWPSDSSHFLSEEEGKFWDEVWKIREGVHSILEKLRDEKVLKQSLEGSVHLYLDESKMGLFGDHGELLKRALIVSHLAFHPMDGGVPDGASLLKDVEGVAARVISASGIKCTRCWNYSEQTGDNPDFPGLCPRCIAAVQV
ncbi:MAG: isoleucine--tRNA ligase [bacterium]